MDVHSRDVPATPPEAAATAAPALETLGQLAGQFAHDINNLLASVLTGAELAAQREGDARVRGLLAGAIAAIQRQGAFTAAMAQASRRCERPAVVDAHALVEACREDLGRVLGACTLETRLDAADPRIRCDPGFLRTALLHLASNARAAMPDGGRLLLATRNRDARGLEPQGGVLLLTAVDEGSGMTEEVRRRAFEPFFSTREGANGLGLAQVRDTMRRAGGSVALESVPGRGTAIDLAFPLACGRPAAWHGT